MGQETKISSIYWTQLSKLHLKTKIEYSLQNVVFEIKDRTMDNVQNCDDYINIDLLLFCFAIYVKIY
jgi:hypothetical protein